MKLQYCQDHSFVCRPFAFAGAVLHLCLRVPPPVGKYGVATIVIFTGAYMACNPIHAVPHFVWDGVAYTIHGFGAAPFIEKIVRFINKLEGRQS